MDKNLNPCHRAISKLSHKNPRGSLCLLERNREGRRNTIRAFNVVRQEMVASAG